MGKPFLYFLILFLGAYSFDTLSMPKTRLEYGYTPEKFPKVRVINEASITLLCSISIDGYKLKFKLNPSERSQWYKATDKQFVFVDFSVWCEPTDSNAIPSIH